MGKRACSSELRDTFGTLKVLADFGNCRHRLVEIDPLGPEHSDADGVLIDRSDIELGCPCVIHLNEG